MPLRRSLSAARPASLLLKMMVIFFYFDRRACTPASPNLGHAKTLVGTSTRRRSRSRPNSHDGATYIVPAKNKIQV
jgi:hypothetical protein